MSQEEKAERETMCGPMRDFSFVKKLQSMFDESEGDCAKMMSHMKAACCGSPVPSDEREESVEGEKRP